jgi:predicted RNA-binding Zn-ribbon protein involved in translation (DUF1610 family)
MATIKATCPLCGDVDLAPRQVTVHVVEAIDDADSRRTYEFSCPSCADRIEKPADAEVARLLASAGVRTTTVPVPPEAREGHHGAPIGYDDLLDLVLFLETHDTLAAEMAPSLGR